jgi:hypothetical protein
LLRCTAGLRVQVCKGVHSKGVHSSFEGKGFAKTASCADRYGRCGNRGRAAAIGHATYIRCSKRMAAGSVREPGWGLVDPFSTVGCLDGVGNRSVQRPGLKEIVEWPRPLGSARHFRLRDSDRPTANFTESTSPRTRAACLAASRIGERLLGRDRVRSIVPHLRFGELGAIGVEHEKPNGR